jgi:tail-anchored protein insertion receptor
MSQQKSLQSQLLRTSADLKSTSSQDEFAKWARLNRQHDKQIEDLKKLNSAIDSHRAMFRRVVRIGVWLGTTGVKGGVQWWYSKEPVFWLPAGTFPVWVEWIVAFPKAPKGICRREKFD